jgi:tRNA threonylcarbamoyladenosine biosynthesis protein TsaB
VILLALDTCDARGSLAILRDGEVLKVIVHQDVGDYSSWILPTADAALAAIRMKMKDVDVFAVASGPGSFTGLRVGLTTVKAWSEVYGAQIAGVSRLEAMATQAAGEEVYLASFVDAQRQQVFGGLYRRDGDKLGLVGEEMVVAPEGFVEFVVERAGQSGVAWISMDPDKVTALEVWAQRARVGERVQMSPTVLAPVIGKIGWRRALEGRLTDALKLDADYIRRSDAEIFWKRGAGVRAESKKESAAASVRKLRPEDLDAVLTIAAESPEVASWSRESYLKLADETGSLALVLTAVGKVTGFVVGRHMGDEAEVLNLAVRAKQRRRGWAKALLEVALQEFATQGAKRAYLEVRESNRTAIAFYEKQGFAKTGLRKGYYREPDEAAVVMEKKLTG